MNRRSFFGFLAVTPFAGVLAVHMNSGKIAATGVNVDKLAAGAVTADKIAPGTIAHISISDEAIKSAKIAMRNERKQFIQDLKDAKRRGLI